MIRAMPKVSQEWKRWAESVEAWDVSLEDCESVQMPVVCGDCGSRIVMLQVTGEHQLPRPISGERGPFVWTVGVKASRPNPLHRGARTTRAGSAKATRAQAGPLVTMDEAALPDEDRLRFRCRRGGRTPCRLDVVVGMERAVRAFRRAVDQHRGQLVAGVDL